MYLCTCIGRENQHKPELSKKNPYWIPREKYYELLYFSRQYNTMRQEKKELLSHYPSIGIGDKIIVTDISDPVVKAAARIETLTEKMQLIEETVREVDPDIYKWLLMGVTTDYSYDYLDQKMHMPMSRSAYYERYRKYFYLLAKKR